MTQPWLRYANQGAIRNDPLSAQLVNAMSFLPDLGVTMEVFSGGQENNTTHGTGSPRHNHGNSADVFFYKDGRRLDGKNPQDLPVFQEIVSRGKAAGLTGFGAGQGYMQPGSMHIGYGNAAVWGKDGKGANAPGWLRQAYGVAPAGTVARSNTGVDLMTAPQQPEKRGLGGLLADPDKRDRLIMALEGMTLNPNKGLQQMAAQGIQDRRQAGATQQQANRTAQWLQSQGRDDLAQAVVSGSLDPKTAVQTALTPPKDDRTALMKNYEFAVQQGFEGSFTDYLKASRQTTNNNFGGQPLPPGVVSVDDKGGLVTVVDPSAPGGFRQVPISGGKADAARAKVEAEAAQEATAEVGRRKKVLDTAKEQAQVVNNSIDYILSQTKDHGVFDLPAAGIIGERLANLGVNQEARDVQNELLTLKGTIAFDRLQDMREASKTGGALGAVSERELSLLAATLGSLEQSTGVDRLEANLNTVKEITNKIFNDPVAAYYYQNGTMPPQGYFDAPAPQTPAPAAPVAEAPAQPQAAQPGGLLNDAPAEKTPVPQAAPAYLSPSDAELWPFFTDDEKRSIMGSYKGGN